jgi:cell division septation protein DedD
LKAQDADVQRYIGMVNNGQVEEVRQEIAMLLEKYPNNPGVLYVQGLVAKDGAEAARIYQSIVDNFPKSKYADGALYRVYQFYYALGLYRTAVLKMNQLKRDYPGSRYLKPEAKESVSLPEEAEPPTAVAPMPEHSPVAVNPREQTSVTPTSFSLQVGAYGTQTNAEKQRKFFVALGYSVEMVTKVRDTKTLYVVLIGNFGSYEEAKAKGAEIKRKHNIDSMVVPR